MRLFTKMLLASCLFIQTHPSQAGGELVGSMTAPDAKDASKQVMEKLQGMFKSHGESETLKLINGHEHQGANVLQVEENLGNGPLLCVEKQNGKLIVVATRRGSKEIGTDLTTDATHLAIVEKLKTEPSTTIYYVDSTNRTFAVRADSYKALENVKDTKTSSTEQRCFYCATEIEVPSAPSGATVLKSEKRAVK